MPTATIEHIGSTSVPSLAAKPIIDIMVITDRLAEIARDPSRIEALGYEFRPHLFADDPDHLFFVWDTKGQRVIISITRFNDHLNAAGLRILHASMMTAAQNLVLADPPQIHGFAGLVFFSGAFYRPRRHVVWQQVPVIPLPGELSSMPPNDHTAEGCESVSGGL